MLGRLHGNNIIFVVADVAIIVIVVIASGIVNVVNLLPVSFIFIIDLYFRMLICFYGIQARRAKLTCLKIYRGKTNIALLYNRRVKRIEI